MKAIIHNLDFFKTPLFLRIDQNEKLSSNFGICLSLIIMIFLSVYFLNSDIFYKQRPNTTDQGLFLVKHDIFNFNAQNFGLIGGVTDNNGIALEDPQIFSLELTQIVFNNSIPAFLEQSKKKFHLCNIFDFEYDQSILKKLSFDKLYCPDNSSLYIEGSYSDEIHKFFQISVVLCNNETMNNSCKSRDEIEKFFNDKFLMLYHKESSYNLMNYSNPIQNNYKMRYWTLNPNIKKLINIKIKMIDIITDDGLVFQENKISQSFMVDEIEYDIDLNTKESILNVGFYSTDKKQYATRNYQKIQEVLANMGGMFSLFLSMGFIIIKMPNEIRIINRLMNELYIFQTKNKVSEGNKINFPTEWEKNKKKLNENKLEQFLAKNKENNNKVVNLSVEIPLKQHKDKNISYVPQKNLIDDSFTLEHFSRDYINNNQDKKYDTSKLQSCNSIPNFIIIKKNNSLKNFDKTQNIQTLPNILNLNNKSNNLKRLKLFEEIINKNNDFFISLKEYIIFKFKNVFKIKLNEKEKLFKKTQNLFYQEIDLIKILKRVHEIEKLKFLTLNKRQLYLFDFISKPLIHLSSEHDQKKIFNMSASHKITNLKNMVENKNSKDLIYYYNITYKNKKFNEIDSRILKFIDKAI